MHLCHQSGGGQPEHRERIYRYNTFIWDRSGFWRNGTNHRYRSEASNQGPSCSVGWTACLSFPGNPRTTTATWFAGAPVKWPKQSIRRSTIIIIYCAIWLWFSSQLGKDLDRDSEVVNSLAMVVVFVADTAAALLKLSKPRGTFMKDFFVSQVALKLSPSGALHGCLIFFLISQGFLLMVPTRSRLLLIAQWWPRNRNFIWDDEAMQVECLEHF